MDFDRMVALMVFVVAMSLVVTLYACVNVTPLKMRDRDMCWSEERLRYERCPK